MSDAIEKMKEEGWVQMDKLLYQDDDKEYAIFSRYKQIPNAVVDWQELESYLSDMETGRRFALSSHAPHLLATLQSAASDIRRFIKKS